MYICCRRKPARIIRKNIEMRQEDKKPKTDVLKKQRQEKHKADAVKKQGQEKYKADIAKKQEYKADTVKEQKRNKAGSMCPVSHKCGGCQYIDIPYKKQLKKKQRTVSDLLSSFARTEPIIGMENPYHYRNKVSAAFSRDHRGNIISGVYEEGSHFVVPVDLCLLENEKADEIIVTIRSLLRSFKLRVYDEDTGYGLLRHVLVRTAHATGEIMVVLVTASPVFPSKNNFVKALRERHPEITTIVQNVNGRNTSMVLGNKENVLYGKGYIEDVLCGKRFRISPRSFYQINSVQTEILYRTAISYAGCTGREKVLDAYCGTGTIGIIAAERAGEVIGVELNGDAVRDAVTNARQNAVKNISFYHKDAGEFMCQLAEQKEHIDVVFMDPPRAGSDEAFLNALCILKPDRVVYVSCNPQTLQRDLHFLTKRGYTVQKIQPVDMFPNCVDVEVVTCLQRMKS